ncbi:MAG: YfhO family protein [Chitinispirillaceae bacterium]|jgi:hypothetical protein|nr:YfhO family protein [Chitinispirillaceae bacterium]
MSSKLKKKPGRKTVSIPVATVQADHAGIRHWQAIGLLVLVCVLFFFQVISGMGNFWEDTIQMEFPNRVFARDSFLAFSFPHWNPYSFNGMPFLATQLPGVLYPLNIVISFLPLKLDAFWYCVQMFLIAHFAIAGMTMFVFLRGRGCGNGAGFFGALSYMLSGFLVTHIVHPMMINILAWVPLVLFFLEKAFRDKSFKSAVAGGLVLGMTTLAGHPQIVMYEVMFLCACSAALILSSEKKNIMIVLIPVILLLIGVGVSMVQTLPSVEINSQAARAEWTFAAASEGSISFRQLLTIVLPKLFGAWTGSAGETVPAFWLEDSAKSGYYTYWETSFYSGIAVLLLAIAFMVTQREKLFVLLLGVWLVFSIAYAMGEHFILYRLIFDYVPPLKTFRSPGRILFTWQIILTLFSAQAFSMLPGIDRKSLFYKVLIVGALVCLALGIAAAAGLFTSMWPEMAFENRAVYAQQQGLLLCLNAVLILMPVLLYVNAKIPLRMFKASLCLALVTDLFVFGFGHHVLAESQAQKLYGGNEGLIKQVQEKTAKPLSRISVRQFILEPDGQIVRQSSLMIVNKCQGMVDRFQTLEGFSPLSLLRRVPPATGAQFRMFLDLCNVSFFINPEYGEKSPQLILPNNSMLPRAKMFYRVKNFAEDSLVSHYMKSGELDYKNELAICAKDDVPLLTGEPDTANTVRITKYGPNKISLDVRTKSPGLLWLSEIWYSAWRAKVDGKKTKVYCADGSFRAIAVPAGSHKAEFYYSSTYFNIGACITLATVFAAGLILVFGAKRKKHVTPE